MNKESLYKALLMLGGGFLVFMLVKPKGDKTITNKSTSPTQSASGKSKPITDEDRENADIVMTAFAMAMDNNESPENIAKLNSETMKEFGLRCYANKNGNLVVCNQSGEIVLNG